MQKNNCSSGERIYDEIKKEIMFLELLPGQNVNEGETAERFSVSRTPVRDAFRLLEMKGLIEVKRGRGTFVSLINIDELDDIIYMRRILETAVVREIGELSTAQEVRLRLLLSEQRALLDSGLDDTGLAKKFLELDNELHGALFQLANKDTVWTRISGDSPHYNRLRVLTNLYDKKALEKLYQEHVQIVEAIKRGEHAGLEEFYRTHLYGGMDKLSQIVGKNREFFTGNL
ncbi:MAG TPA: GntR family transcriptional regulator [Firmicutes bacterium]|nr:GntR family transcriptional regulator [Bacillota bacterium]